jgi:hypothetical protein
MHYQLAKDLQPNIWKELGNGESDLAGIATKRFWTDSSPERDLWLDRFWTLTMPWWDRPVDFRPIHFAAYFGLEHLTKSLLIGNKLQRSKTANEKTARTDMTPLHWAARNGHSSVVQELLQVEGIELNGKGYKMTPLLWAVHNGHIHVVELLLKGNVDAEVGVFGKTPLLWAVSDGNADLVRLLLKYSAKANTRVGSSNVKIANRIATVTKQAARTFSGQMQAQAFNEMQAEQETNAEREIGEARERVAQQKTLIVGSVCLILVILCLALASTRTAYIVRWESPRPLLRAFGWELEHFMLILVVYGLHWLSLPVLYRFGYTAVAARGSIIQCASWAGLLSGEAIMCLSITVCCTPSYMVTEISLGVIRSLSFMTKLILIVVPYSILARTWLLGIEASVSFFAVAVTIIALFTLLWVVFPGFLVFLLAVVLDSHADIGVKEWSELAAYFLAFAVAAYCSVVAHLIAYREGFPEWRKRAKCYSLLLASPLTSIGLVWLRPLPNVAERGIVHLAVAALAGIWAFAGIIFSVGIVETLFAAPEFAKRWRGPAERGHTALHIAVQRGYKDIVKLLLPKADIDAITNLGQKAEEFTKDKEMLDILKSHRLIVRNNSR